MSDDLLGPLRDEPVPPLAPAATVRARGDQRTRRRRGALAGAVAAVVLAAGVTLADPRGSDELRPEPFATAAPTTEPLEAALLDPEDVAAVLPGEWDDLPNESPFSVPPVGCPATAAPLEPSAARFLTDGGRIVGQSLSQHPDERAADDRYQQLLASLRACGESSPAYRLFGEGGDTRTRTYGEMLTSGEPVRPFSIERVGRVLVTLVLQGPAEPSPELTEAAARKVRELRADEPTPDEPLVSFDQLLDAPTVTEVLGGSWSAQPDERAAFPFITPCAEGGAGASDGRSRFLTDARRWTVGSQVLAYADERAAAASYDALIDDVERCPEVEQDSGDGPVRHRIVGGLPGSGPMRSYGTITFPRCEDCVQHFALSLVGSRIALVRMVGAPAEQLPPLADAAQRRVLCATASCPEPEQPASDWPLEAVYLSPEEASAAEDPGWRITSPSGPVAEPLADPCGQGDAPLPAEVVDSAGRAMGSTREAGGSSLAQQVYRYSSSAIASAAFAEYADRYRRCAEVPAEQSPEGTTTRSEVVDSSADRLVVRRIPCMQGSCTEHFATYEMVLRRADAVTVVGYMIGEDGDPAQEALLLAAAVERRLRSAVGG